VATRPNKENGVTVILTTHDMGDIDALTDRVMLIGKGQILFNGSFTEMKSKSKYAKNGEDSRSVSVSIEEIIAEIYEGYSL